MKGKKRWLAILALAVMAAGCCSLASCNQGADLQGLVFEKIEGKEEYRVTNTFMESVITNITIPDTYLGLPVTEIGSLHDCGDLKSITIPSTIKRIEAGVFSWWNGNSLERVYIEDVASWCEISFGDYSANPLYTGADLYVNNTLLTELVIPDSVTAIGEYAFYNCDSLTSVTIGDGVTSIGDDAFHFCYLLNRVTIGDSVTLIDSDAFSLCYNLKSITVKENNTTYKDIDGNLYTKDGKTLIRYASGKKDKSFIIPDGVTSIGDAAVSDDFDLTSVVIPDSVTSIGDYAFGNQGSLTSVVLGNGVTSIGYAAFSNSKLIFNEYENCLYLGSETNPYHALMNTKTENASTYTIHEDTKLIGGSAFYNCDRLTNVVIPDSVISIERSAFYDCDGLTSVVIPDSVISIEWSAFRNCSNLTSVVIPDSVASIGDNAFGDCYRLTSISCPAFMVSCFTTTNLQTVSITSGNRIQDKAFYDCNSLTSVVISNSVTTIGDWAFHSCDSLTSVYYQGTASGWENVSRGVGNSYLMSATIYYYSETEQSGCWYYNENGEVAIW